MVLTIMERNGSVTVLVDGGPAPGSGDLVGEGVGGRRRGAGGPEGIHAIVTW